MSKIMELIDKLPLCFGAFKGSMAKLNERQCAKCLYQTRCTKYTALRELAVKELKAKAKADAPELPGCYGAVMECDGVCFEVGCDSMQGCANLCVELRKRVFGE